MRSLTLFIACIVGCASANPIPVTDNNRATQKGLRYYEARPFVAVHRPFPLDSRTYLVDAVVSPDGRYIRVTGAIPETSDLVHYKDQLAQLSFRMVFRKSKEAEPALQGGGSGATGGPQAQGAPTPEPAPLKTGQSTVSLQTDLNGVGFFPLSEYMSMIFLPDYDREFAIDTSGKFGSINVDLKRGPGGTLLALSAEVDNSAITGPLVKGYASLVDAGVAAAKAAISAASGLPTAQGATVAAPLTTAESMEAMEAQPGMPVTLRIHVVKFAAIGIYPMVKESEVADYTEKKADLEDACYVVPVEAYQIPYKYFTIVVVEHLISDGSPSQLLGFRGTAAGPTPGTADQKKLRDIAATPDKLNLFLAGTPEKYKIEEVVERSPAKGDVDTITLRYTRGDGKDATEADDARLVELFTKALPGTKFTMVR